MRSGSGLDVVINIQKEELAKKVVHDLPTVNGKFISYPFTVVIHDVKEDEDSYTIVGVDRDFTDYFDDIEDAIFEYSLDKDKGKFDFSKLEWDQVSLVTLEYRVDKDFKYFTEYSICVLKNVFGTLEGSICVINREVNKWSVEIVME